MAAKVMTSQAANAASARVITAQDLQLENTEKTAVSPVAFATCIRALRQNWRQGTVGCKTRGEVSFSNKKPWRQKGTGRARVSSLRSPLWRKGGIIFGPQPRVRTLKVSTSLKKNAMASLLWNFLDQERIVSLSWEHNLQTPKTSMAYQALKAAGLHNKKVAVFVGLHDVLAQSSFANLANVNLMLYDQPNAYDLVNAECWVVLHKDSDSFKEMVSRWL